jgi:predicted amino acid dehydrogenase
MLDRIPRHYRGPSVTFDNQGAGRLAAEHLLDLGHRQLAHVTGPESVHISQERLEQLKAQLTPTARGEVGITTSVEQGIKEADIVITVSSAVHAIIEPGFIKRGAVVCDIARPRDVSARVQHERNDVLVIEGGVVAVPGENLNFNFNFGFPERTAYACMSETMMLALEGRYENFTLGKTVSLEQVEETQRLAAKHGFKLAGFRNFERAVTQEQIDQIRRNAGR